MTINTTNHADFVPEVWAAQALGYLKSNSVMLNLVNRDYDATIAKAGDTINISKRGTLTTQTKTAGGTWTPQSPTGTGTSVTLVHEGVPFIVEDAAEAQSAPELMAGYIEDGIAVIGEKIDADLLALYSSLSTTPLDYTAGIAVGAFTEAGRVLTDNKASTRNRNIVWRHDAQAEILQLDQFTSAQYDPANATALQMATMGAKYGFNHYMDQQVVTATSECKNIAFHRDAFVLATRPLPLPGGGVQATTMVENGIGIRVVWGYNMSYGGWQVNIEILYAVGVLRADQGVVIRSSVAS